MKRNARGFITSFRVSLGFVGLLVAVGAPPVAYSQAFCALRDPVQTIYGLYPEASSYQSIVATVGEEAREDISTRLDMPMHRGELGQHTLYVALSGDRPLGLVHVRAERTDWGLAEIVWALDFDLRVIDFSVQRCRAPGRSAIESDAFRSQFRGHSLGMLSQMLAPGGTSLNAERIRVSDTDHELAVAIVTSGLKAIVASETVWGDEIRRLKTSAQARP